MSNHELENSFSVAVPMAPPPNTGEIITPPEEQTPIAILSMRYHLTEAKDIANLASTSDIAETRARLEDILDELREAANATLRALIIYSSTPKTS